MHEGDADDDGSAPTPPRLAYRRQQAAHTEAEMMMRP